MKNRNLWRVNFGDDVGLPNICDRNCAGCYDDFGISDLTTSPPDKRNELFNRLGENWFPDNWTFKSQWKDAIQKHFKDSEDFKYFLFTGRGDPLFYMPCIQAYMKTYKDLKYEGYATVCTSASLLNQERLNQLVEWGIDEINFNLVATNFDKKILHQMELAKRKLNVGVELPLLNIYENQLLKHLPFLNFVGLKHLTLSTTRIYSKAGAEKLQTVIPKTTEVTKLSEREAIIKNQPMVNRIIKEIKKRKYDIEVIVNE
jgi:hypothetical protein